MARLYVEDNIRARMGAKPPSGHPQFARKRSFGQQEFAIPDPAQWGVPVPGDAAGAGPVATSVTRPSTSVILVGLANVPDFPPAGLAGVGV